MRPDTLTAPCGHQVRVASTATVRARKLAASRPCPDCYRAQQAQETLRASRALGLRILAGTDKQLAWAYRIRLSALWRAVRHATGYGGFDSTRDSALLRELVAAANTRATAGQWIGLNHHAAEALLADCGYIEELSTLPLGSAETLPQEQYEPAPW